MSEFQTAPYVTDIREAYRAIMLAEAALIAGLQTRAKDTDPRPYIARAKRHVESAEGLLSGMLQTSPEITPSPGLAGASSASQATA
jgi:hypothetical protein